MSGGGFISAEAGRHTTMFSVSANSRVVNIILPTIIYQKKRAIYLVKEAVMPLCFLLLHEGDCEAFTQGEHGKCVWLTVTRLEAQ